VIRDLPADGVVREAGAYRIPIRHYHTQAVCPGPSISSSGLRTIYNKSPADFWAFSEWNPNRYPSSDASDALLMGRAAHCLIMGDEVFEESFFLLDPDAPPKPTKAQIRARDEGRVSDSARERFDFWDALEGDTRDIIPAAWYADIHHMSRALAAHPLVAPLFDGEPEVSLIWQDEPTGLWVKSRMDMHPSMGGIRADLKTATDVSLRAVMRSIGKYSYDMQAALGSLGAEIVLGERIESSVLVFAQTTPPYSVSPIEIDDEALHWAKLKNRKALDTAARCLETGDWPGPVEGIPKYAPPDWEQDELAEAQSRGEFPRSFFAPAGASGAVHQEGA